MLRSGVCFGLVASAAMYLSSRPESIAMATPNANVDAAMTPTYEALAQHLLEKSQALGPRQYWVGLAGGPGAGKSTLAAAVIDRLNTIAGDELGVVLPMDGFHYSRAELQRLADAPGSPPGALEALLRRRGAPWTFDAEALCSALGAAKASGSGSFPTYSRALSDPVPDGVRVKASHRVVLIEGNYLLKWSDPRWAPLRAIFDECWFVRCASVEEQRERLVTRHLQTWTEEKERIWGEGRAGAAAKADANDVLNLAEIEVTRSNADRIIESLVCG